MSIEQDPAAARSRARDGGAGGRAAPLARQEHQPRRGSALPPRPGPLHRRHQAARHGARGDRAQPARARTHRRHRHRGGRAAARAWSRVVTGEDVAERAAPLPSFGAGPIVQDMIAIEKVRHYGEAVAAVIAENRYIAEDACDLIEVEYEPLPVVLDPFEARRGRRAARARDARHERRLRAHVHVRRGRPGVRRGAAQGAGEAALAALDRHADGHERRHRRLRPRHGRGHDLRELDELHVLPVADRRRR